MMRFIYRSYFPANTSLSVSLDSSILLVILVSICLVSQVISAQDTIEKSNNVKPISSREPISERIPHERTVHVNESDAQTMTSREINADPEQTFELILNEDQPQKYPNSLAQMNRHSYNVSLSTGNTNSTQTSLSNCTFEELNTSDSRLVPQSISSRFDEELNPYNDDYSFGDIDAHAEGASSNLNQQRVVKELTKILSKGMSGATDQVRLETLENLKRRQRERKIAKDTRAKLFEDILTAAISSHPEKMKGKNKKGRRDRSAGSSISSGSSTLANNLDVEPELAVDAETVIQHLQGLSTLTDGQAAPQFAGLGGDETGLNSESPINEDSQEGSGSDELSSQEVDENSSKKAIASNDRPIIRQFKKIKEQISQRRKQLDQIKKIFNVELAINPKDGTLIGKSSSKKKNNPRGSGEIDDYTIIDESRLTGKKKTGGQSKSSKMRELSVYLKENPEILASVMAELTVGADPSRSTSSDLADDGIYDSNLNQNAYSSSPSAFSTHRIKPSGASRLLMNVPWDKPRRFLRPLSSINPDFNDPVLFNNIRRGVGTQRSVNHGRDSVVGQDTIDDLMNTPGSRAAEALLLRSLRERQLINLARLEMVLAEQQQASNRSQVFSRLNAPTTGNGENDQRQLRDGPGRSQTSSRHQHGNQTDDETLHHFMVVNPNSSESPPSPVTWNHSHQQQWNSSPYNLQLGEYQRLHYMSPQLGLRSGQQQFQEKTLKRFRNWRDVSQSEASSSQLNDTNSSAPVTWVPYDLTTGSSTRATEAQNSTSHVNNYHHGPLDTYNVIQKNYPGPYANYQRENGFSDLSVTRPGSLGPRYAKEKEGPIPSPFMTRSSVAENDLSTGNLPIGDELPKDPAGSQQKINRKAKVDRQPDEPIMEKIEPDDDDPERESEPGDYFKSYKTRASDGELSKNGNAPAGRGVQRNLRVETTDDSVDEAGAIWAR